SAPAGRRASTGGAAAVAPPGGGTVGDGTPPAAAAPAAAAPPTAAPATPRPLESAGVSRTPAGGASRVFFSLARSSSISFSAFFTAVLFFASGLSRRYAL